MPDQVRHDKLKLNTFWNYDKVCYVGMTAPQLINKLIIPLEAGNFTHDSYKAAPFCATRQHLTK
jgi:hypothetical protein